MNKTFFEVKSPVQRTRHCWMLHVPSVYTPCCMLLLVVWSCCAKFETGQTFEPTTPYISFVPWPPKRGARTLDAFAQLFQHFWGHARAKMAAECNFTKSNGLYHSHDVLQVHRKVVASVCTCCPSCAETEEGQLSRDVRYSEADKEDLLSSALESICKLETKKNAFKYHLADLVNGFLTEFETARQNERYNQRKHLHGSYNTKWKL